MQSMPSYKYFSIYGKFILWLGILGKNLRINKYVFFLLWGIVFQMSGHAHKVFTKQFQLNSWKMEIYKRQCQGNRFVFVGVCELEVLKEAMRKGSYFRMRKDVW